MTFREIEKILKADKWVLIRITGSHYQYRKVGVFNSIVVPNHNGKDLSIGVVKDLEKKDRLISSEITCLFYIIEKLPTSLQAVL